MEITCMKEGCGNTFRSPEELRQHIIEAHINKRREEFGKPAVKPKKKPVVEEVKAPAEPEPVSKPIPPIILEYKYKGACQVCNMEVATVLIDVQDKQVAVAFCKNCEQQLHQQTVIPIIQQ